MCKLAIDIGGTYLKHGLIIDGHLQEVKRVATNKASLLSFEKQLYDLIQSYEKIDLQLIGISVPGKVSKEDGVISFGGALPFLHGYPMKQRITEWFHVRTIVENDAKAAALAELYDGEFQGIDTGAMIVLGTAVGSGIICRGQLLEGPHFQAGEISYMVLDRAIRSEESFVAAQGSAVQLIQRLQACLKTTDEKDALFARVKESQPAMAILTDYCEHIALLIFNLQTILDLEKVLLGGGVSNQPLILEGINQYFDRLYAEIPSVQRTFTKPLIQIGKYRSEANLIGAVLSS